MGAIRALVNATSLQLGCTRMLEEIVLVSLLSYDADH